MKSLVFIIIPKSDLREYIKCNMIFQNTSERELHFFTDLDHMKEFFFEWFLWDIERIVYIDVARNLIDSELKIGDIIIPHTYLSDKKPPIFIDNSIWDTYNFEKFELQLSGVCITPEIEWSDEGFHGDIEHDYAYNFLSFLEVENLSQIFLWVFFIDPKNEHREHILHIINFIISE